MWLAEAAAVPEAIKGNPWVIYGSMIVLGLGWIATVSETLQKLLGPLGRWLAARQARRAARAASLTDVRIKDIQGQVDHLGPRVDSLEDELYQLRQLVARHSPWDWAALDVLRRGQADYPDPPPLVPPKPDPRQRGDHV